MATAKKAAKKKNTYSTYEFHAYYKQGEDFNHLLNQSKTVSEALIKWAENLEESATQMRGLSKLFQGQEINSNSDTHMVAFEGDPKILSKAVEQKLLYEVEFECDDDDLI